VLGIDRSGQMLDRARKAYPHLSFREADAENLPFDASGLSATVANFCLLHVGRPERVVAEMTRVLITGGRMAATVWGPPDRARIFGVAPEAVRAAGALTPSEIPTGPDFFLLAEDEQFSRLLSEAGLEDIVVRTVDFAHRIPDVTHLWEGMVNGSVRTRALLALQTSRMRQRIRTQLERLIEPYRVENGFDIPVCVKVASGRKG
jgi:SAM-dependent methyltransferase